MLYYVFVNCQKYLLQIGYIPENWQILSLIFIFHSATLV